MVSQEPAQCASVGRVDDGQPCTAESITLALDGTGDEGLAQRPASPHSGLGSAEEGFVHLDVRFLAGRPSEVKRAVGEALLAALRAAYVLGERPVQITVEIRDIPQESYFKFPDGTLG